LDSVYIRHGGLVNCLIRMGLPRMLDIVSMQMADQMNLLISHPWNSFSETSNGLVRPQDRNNPCDSISACQDLVHFFPRLPEPSFR
jgi:hypothetical protein